MTKSSGEPRILQFCHGYDGPFLDCARQYAALFRQTGYKVTTVFLTGREDSRVAAACESDTVIFMKHTSRSIRGLKFRAIKEFGEIASREHYAVCIAHRTKPTFIACVGTKLPVISVHHAFGDFDRLGRRLAARMFMERLHILAVSDSVRDDIRASLRGWPEKRIQTLYNRIDIEAVQAAQVERNTARERLGIPLQAWVIGNVGRLHPDKDQSTLIRGFAAALPNLPANSLLVICGKGRLEPDLRALAAQLGITDKVIFTGQIPDARSLFKAFDVFALTSDHEPFGMVLLEAMAAGVPIVCSDCGGAPEVVGECGLLFPLKDSLSLSGRFIEAASMSDDQLAGVRKAMATRLNRLFSDQSARAWFWASPIFARLVQV